VGLGLREVVFIPTGLPWLRAGMPISPAHHRLNMVRLAVASNPFFKVSSIEIERPGPSYTIDTLEELRRQMGEDARFFFIVGLDSLKHFHRWKEPAAILERCTIVAVARPGHLDFDITNLDSILPGVSRRVVFLNSPQIGISGTEIRRRVAEGLSIRYWVPEEVERYIRENNLYTDTRWRDERGREAP